jgi:hypothetical protein
MSSGDVLAISDRAFRANAGSPERLEDADVFGGMLRKSSTLRSGRGLRDRPLLAIEDCNP